MATVAATAFTASVAAATIAAATITAATIAAPDDLFARHLWLVRQRRPRARANPSRVRDREDRAGTSPHALCSVQHLRPRILLHVLEPIWIVSVVQLGHDEHG